MVNLKAALCILQVGIASWYGPGQGPLTASGERFDPRGMTAASPYIPFEQDIVVTNLDDPSHPEAELRVNDRGPFVSGRILDVTRRAARALHITGTARVLIQLPCST